MNLKIDILIETITKIDIGTGITRALKCKPSAGDMIKKKPEILEH